MMLNLDVVNHRFFFQLFVNKLFIVEEVVQHLTCIQSQDYPAAKWALGIRLRNSSDAIVEKAFNEGKFLRTHIMRPTWHFVMPEDLHWIQELTSPQVKKLMAHYNRKLELTDELFAKTTNMIVKALEKNKYLTRQEIKALLTAEKIETDVQRLAHIVMWPELEALICSGPRIGKQFTYALVSERAPKARKFARDEALAELAWRYIRSHGPAQIKDFSWWSGLNMKDAQTGIELNSHRIIKETIDEKDYYLSPAADIPTIPSPQAFLLSIYDEYVIAYKDRSALGGERIADIMLGLGNALTAVVILDGVIVGTWKRKITKKNVEVSLKLFEKHTKKEMDAIEKAEEDYKRFIAGTNITN